MLDLTQAFSLVLKVWIEDELLMFPGMLLYSRVALNRKLLWLRERLLEKSSPYLMLPVEAWRVL